MTLTLDSDPAAPVSGTTVGPVCDVWKRISLAPTWTCQVDHRFEVFGVANDEERKIVGGRIVICTERPGDRDRGWMRWMFVSLDFGFVFRR
jgi:hypothetical protein